MAEQKPLKKIEQTSRLKQRYGRNTWAR